jgi:hypothetical protein
MATFAGTTLAKYEALLQTSAGLQTASVDGPSVRHADGEAKWRDGKREVARRGRPTSPAGCASRDARNFFGKFLHSAARQSTL